MIDQNEVYKIVVSDKVDDFEDVFFLVNQLEFIKSDALNIGINLKYANEKLTFFCRYLDTARAIAQTLSDCGFKSTYHFTQDIKLPTSNSVKDYGCC